MNFILSLVVLWLTLKGLIVAFTCHWAAGVLAVIVWPSLPVIGLVSTLF